MLALTLACPAAALAQDEAEDGLPAGRFGVSMGVRQGIGRLGQDFGIGAVGSIEAGYHRIPAARRLSFGLHWSVAWSWFGSDDTASVAGSLNMLELTFGVRMRTVLGSNVPRFLVIGSGASLLRTNVPIPPHDDRSYLGPYVSVGAEQFVLGSMLVGFEARYGFLIDGPGSISMVLGVGFGT